MKVVLYRILLYALLTTFLPACTQKQLGEEAGEDTITQTDVTMTQAQFSTSGIVFGTVELKSLSSAIEVNGMLDVPPQQLVTISALMGGFIKSTDMLQGMRVKKGQVIAYIQNPDFVTVQRDYLENKSRLAYLEQEYKRQQELSKENVSAAKIFQQVSAEYNSALVVGSALKEKLSMIGINTASLDQGTIRSSVGIISPINGYVTVVNINVGKFVSPQDVICEIVDTDHLHAELTVFEKDITKVKVGQKVRFFIVNEDGIERTAHVYLINHKISEDRTVRIHAHMDKEDPSLIPNMYLKAFIEVEQKEVNTLPDEAVVSFGEREFVFVASDKPAKTGYNFEAVEVKKGISAMGYTEVIFPPNIAFAKQQFVVKGAYDVLSKMNNIEEE